MSGQIGRVREQLVAINREEVLVKFNADTEVEMNETRQRKGRVIGPTIA